MKNNNYLLYKNAVITTYDIVLQLAISEHVDYKIIKITYPKQDIFIEFDSGINIFDISEPFTLYVVSKESELHIKKILFDIKKYTHNKHAVIICLDDIESERNKKKDYSVFGYSIIKPFLDSYSPVFANYLNNIGRTDNIEGAISSEETNLNIEEKSSTKINADTLSKEHSDEYKRIINNSKEPCAFFLGNGVSIPLGADPWNTLVNNLVDYLSPIYITKPKELSSALSNSSYLLSSFAKSTFESKKNTKIYQSGLIYCVYRKYNSDVHHKDTLLRAVALAKIKHPKTKILTYNYDTFLENQLFVENGRKINSYHGNKYKRFLDTHIIHLHGIVKQKQSKKSDYKIILSDEEYFDAYLSKKKSWIYRIQEEILSTHKCLFIGSSMSDLFQLSIINEVKKNKGNDWFCYALMCCEGLKDDEKMNLLRFYLKKGIKVIFCPSFDNLGDYLNKITMVSFATKKNIESKE